MVPLQQSWAYGEVIEGLGGKVRRLEVRDGDRILAMCQCLRRRIGLPVTLINRGPVWHDGVDAIQRGAALGFLRIRLQGLVLVTPPDQATADSLRASRFRQVMTPSTLAILTLDDQMRSRLHGKWRNRLNAAERSSLDVRTNSDAGLIRWLLATDAQQQRTRGYRSLPAAFSEAWLRERPSDILVFTAFGRRAPVAAMLFLVHGRTATYHVGWTGAAGRAASAHHLLLWSACQHFHNRGLRHLDLGTIDTENAPALARFKLGTGATPVPTGGTWLGW